MTLGNPRLLVGSPDRARTTRGRRNFAEARAAGVATLSGIANALTVRGVRHRAAVVPGVRRR